MDNSRLDQVTGAIQFMQVAKVLKTVTRPPRKNVAVEVAIGLLGVCQELYGPVNESFNLIVGMVLEISTSGFKPLRDIRIPENAASPIPGAGFLPTAMHARVESQRVQLSLMLHFIVDVEQGNLSDQLLLTSPEAFRNGNARLI